MSEIRFDDLVAITTGAGGTGGLGHTSCVLTQRPSMGVMLNP